MYAIDQGGYAQSNLDKLPLEVFGIVVGHLNNQIGTRSFINEKDIKVVLKNVYRLGRVNKALHAQVHNDLTTDALISFLSKRFQKDSLDIAALIHNDQGRSWIKKYAHKHGDYELFKVVQDIFTIRNEMMESLQGIDFYYLSRAQYEPRLFCSQTLHGLMLKVEPDEEIASLLTPWGEVKLFGGSVRECIGFLAAQQEFSKRVATHFESISTSDSSEAEYYEDSECYELVRPIDLKKCQKLSDVCTKISGHDLHKKKGQSVIIGSTRSKVDLELLYTIKAVDDIQLPDAEMVTEEKYRNPHALETLWYVMEAEYAKHDVYVRVPSASSSMISSDDDEPEERVYPKPYTVMQSSPLKTLDELPAYCMWLMKALHAQPLFNDESSSHIKTKVLTCESGDDCKIVEILTEYADTLLDKLAQPSIRTCGFDRILYSNGQNLGYGLQLVTNENSGMSSLDTLEERYKAVIAQVRDGWRRAKLRENQNIAYLKSEEEWLLVTKKRAFEGEDTLMRFLLSKFGLDRKITCDSAWKWDNLFCDIIYMWVRKDARDELNRIFGMQIAE